MGGSAAAEIHDGRHGRHYHETEKWSAEALQCTRHLPANPDSDWGSTELAHGLTPCAELISAVV